MTDAPSTPTTETSPSYYVRSMCNSPPPAPPGANTYLHQTHRRSVLQAISGPILNAAIQFGNEDDDDDVAAHIIVPSNPCSIRYRPSGSSSGTAGAVVLPEEPGVEADDFWRRLCWEPAEFEKVELEKSDDIDNDGFLMPPQLPQYLRNKNIEDQDKWSQIVEAYSSEGAEEVYFDDSCSSPMEIDASWYD